MGLRRSGGGVKDGQEVLGGVGAGTGLPSAFAGAAESEAGSCFRVQEKEKRGAGFDQDLGLVLMGFEFGGTSQESRFEVGGALDRRAEDGGTQRVEGAAGGVHDDQAFAGEDLGHKASEGLAKGGLRGVAGAQEIADRGVGHELAGLIEKSFYCRSKVDAADLAGFVFQSEPEGFQGPFGGEGDLVDFSQVVIFRGEPEDGDVGDAGGGLGGARAGRWQWRL